MFAENPFKLAIISTKIPDGARTTVYRCAFSETRRARARARRQKRELVVSLP